MTATHTWDFKDIAVDFASGDSGKINHSDRYALDSHMGWLHSHMKTWVNDLSACTWDDTGFTAGTGYVDGTYTGVELKRTPVTGATAGNHCYVDITVSGGAVTSLTVTETGNGYMSGDVVTIEDTAIIGASGAGFEMDCTGGTGLIGFAYDINHSTNNGSRDCEFLLGAHRGLLEWNQMLYWQQQNTTTCYMYTVVSHVPGTTSNGFGSLSISNKGWSQSNWSSTTGQNHKVWVHYDSTPGKEHFFWGDTQYNQPYGIFKIDTAGLTPAVDETVACQFGLFQTGFYSRSWTNRQYNEAVCSDKQIQWDIPDDYGVMFSGRTVRARAVTLGRTPAYLKCSTSATVSTTIAGVPVDVGDPNHTYRRLGTYLVIEEDV